MFKFFLFIFTISCAIKPSVFIEMDDKKTDPYIEIKLKEFNIVTNIPIKFKKIQDKYIAVCKKYEVKKLNIIYINRKEWEKVSEFQKKLTLIHEIGHCEKELEHDNDLLDDGCPKSIMYSNLFSSDCFIKYEKIYTKQVFGDI